MPSLSFDERCFVYVAGPYTNPDPVENTHNAVQVAEALQATGLITCHVPHLSLLWHIIKPHNDVNFWYQYDMAILRRCDALYRIPGKSTGADNEVKYAVEHHIPVFYNSAELLFWIDEHPTWGRNWRGPIFRQQETEYCNTDYSDFDVI